MTTCKIDHNAEGTIPPVLCRTCNPGLAYHLAPVPDPIQEDHTRAVERLRRRDLRALRAEVKTWRNRVTLMKKHKTHPADLRKAEEALRKCEHDLYLVA